MLSDGAVLGYARRVTIRLAVWMSFVVLGCSASDSDLPAAGGAVSLGAGGAANASASSSSVGAGGAASSSSVGAGGATPSGYGTIVPLYTDPSDPTWATIVNAKAAHPSVRVLAVVNPDSGPGAAKNAAYVEGTMTLAKAGVEPFGYVATSYAMKPSDAVKAEIDAYVAWYPAVQGIFFDEMSDVMGQEAYYASLSQYVKSKGLGWTVGNPGTDVPESFAATVDTLVVFENAGYPSIGELTSWHDGYPSSRFGLLSYQVASFDLPIATEVRSHVGFMYVTNDDLPNPWDSLPPYFDALLGALQ
jgi:hypothetical protein